MASEYALAKEEHGCDRVHGAGSEPDGDTNSVGLAGGFALAFDSGSFKGTPAADFAVATPIAARRRRNKPDARLNTNDGGAGSP